MAKDQEPQSNRTSENDLPLVTRQILKKARSQSGEPVSYEEYKRRGMVRLNTSQESIDEAGKDRGRY